MGGSDRDLTATREILDAAIPGAVLGEDGVPPEGALLIDLAHLVAMAEFIKTDPRLRYEMPLFCTVVDHLDREPRFDLVYQVRSLHIATTLRFKVRVPEPTDASLPRVPSLAGVWRAMDWLERETYDLFGIDFTGHNDLRRLLMPDDWEGHPLRKDYISFGEPVRFTDRSSFAPGSAIPSGAPD